MTFPSEKMILVVAKGRVKKSSLEELIDFFNTNDDLESLKEEVSKSTERVFVSWDTVEVIDKDREVVPIDDKLKEFYEKYVHERDGPITDAHTNRVIGKTLAYKILKHPETEKLGILTLNKIHDDYELDDKVWKEIQEGKRGGVSIGGSAKDKHLGSVDGEVGKVLDMNGLWEKASVPEPANPEALVEAFSFAKSTNSISKEQSDSQTNGGNQMTTTSINTQPIQEQIKKTEGVYATVEDLQAFAEKIAMLESKINELVGGQSAAPESQPSAPEVKTEKESNAPAQEDPKDPKEDEDSNKMEKSTAPSETVESAVEKALKKYGLVTETPRPVNKSDRVSNDTKPASIDPYTDIIQKMHAGEKPSMQNLGDVKRAEQNNREQQLKQILGK